MRGLPPVPLDVLHVVQHFDNGGASPSVGFWLFNPSNASITPPGAAAVLSDFFLFVLPNFLALQHEGITPTTCRIVGPGFAITESAPASHGAWTGGQALNVALGIHWLTGQRRPHAGPITYVPGVPDVFIHDNHQLSQLGFGNLQASARDMYDAFPSVRAPDGTPQVVGTLERSAAGVPLTTAQFAPYIGVSATPHVVTIRRRISRTSGLSPS